MKYCPGHGRHVNLTLEEAEKGSRWVGSHVQECPLQRSAGGTTLSFWARVPYMPLDYETAITFNENIFY